MKNYVSIIAIVLCAVFITVKAASPNNTLANTTECSCCKNCKDDKCKALCQKWSGMTAEEQKSVEGKKVKEECMNICKEKKCCSSDGKSSACESMMNGKSCCKK